MVRILISNPIEQYYGAGAKRYVELACLSTDTKPTDKVATGSIAVEVDTGKVFFFNEAGGGEWVEQFAFQEESSGTRSSPSLMKNSLSSYKDGPDEEEPDEEDLEQAER